jgi:hypothetical protein
MMPREKKRYDVRAINAYGIEISMQIVERDGRLILWNGLDQKWLKSAPDCEYEELEQEVKQHSGVSRLVII